MVCAVGMEGTNECYDANAPLLGVDVSVRRLYLFRVDAGGVLQRSPIKNASVCIGG